MNIFALSWDPKVAAWYHCDSHIKMILEYAQILSTVHRVCDGKLDPRRENVLYRSTHVNHPCTKWARKNRKNYRWLYRLFCKLCDKYTAQFGKVHKTDKQLREILGYYPKNLVEGKLTPWPQAMPEEYKVGNGNSFKETILAYRIYYLYDKSRFATWKHQETPWFMNN